MKALKAYNTEAINTFHQRKVHNTEILETPQDDHPGPSVPENDLPDLSESDLDIPDDPILDYVNSQCLSSEDLDQALQAYQAYQVPWCLLCKNGFFLPYLQALHFFLWFLSRQGSQLLSLLCFLTKLSILC